VSAGPYLILAAFWLAEDETDRVAAALPRSTFPGPTSWPRGAVVSFRFEVADSPAFRRDLARLDLAELNKRPS
jgi:hypothetical protein